MKIALFMIMCSGISSDCLPPHFLNTHDTYYDCMINGYQQSIMKTEEIGAEQINEHKIYIKFVCAPEIKEEKST